MRSTKQLRKSEVFQEAGVLPELADRALAAGYHYFLLNGKVFEIEAGRTAGSCMGLRSLRGAQLTE